MKFLYRIKISAFFLFLVLVFAGMIFADLRKIQSSEPSGSAPLRVIFWPSEGAFSGLILIYPSPRRIPVEEAEGFDESKNPFWWLNSGGAVYLTGDRIETPQGAFPEDSPWRRIYAESNPIDTSNGAYPQNVLRLITRGRWNNAAQEAYVRIIRYRATDSPNRNESNGIFFLNRYQNGNTLYYAGIRVDGDAVIKKKYAGTYTTLAQNPVFEKGAYDRNRAQIRIPIRARIGMRSEIRSNADGSADILLFLDKEGNGQWKLAAEARDDGIESGSPPITKSGHAGLRSDFMDIEAEGYRVGEISK